MANVVSLGYINTVGIKRTIIEKPSGTKIYLLNNGFKFKSFPEEFRKLESPEMDYTYNMLLEQTKLNYETISTPTKLVAEDNMLYGYIAPYLTGDILRNIDPLILIEILIPLIKKMEIDIEDLSKEGWQMSDFHDANLLIDGNLRTINVIDTDCYFKAKENAYRKNLKIVFSTIIFAILPKIQLSKTFRKRLIQKYYYMAQEGLMRTSEFLELLLIELKQYREPGLTLEDVRKKL